MICVYCLSFSTNQKKLVKKRIIEDKNERNNAENKTEDYNGRLRPNIIHIGSTSKSASLT